jgi:hypothetical protein
MFQKKSMLSKNAYGFDLKNQMEHLKNVHDLISTMRVNGKKSLLTFQKEMLMSIISLQKLYEDLKSKLDIKYICTYTLIKSRQLGKFLYADKK